MLTRVPRKTIGTMTALLVVGFLFFVWISLVWSTSSPRIISRTTPAPPPQPQDQGAPPSAERTPSTPTPSTQGPQEQVVPPPVPPPTRPRVQRKRVWPEGQEPHELTHNHGSEHRWMLDELVKLELPGIVLDVGANQAGASYAAAIRGIPVISFEALPHNVEVLMERVEKYKLEHLITVVHRAVWDKSGIDVVFHNQAEYYYNGQIDLAAKEADGASTVSVKTVTIDSIVDEDILLLKIDVEGCELKALLGAKNLLRTRRVPFIQLEYSPSNIQGTSGADPNALLYYLSGLGYDVYLQMCHRQFDSQLKWNCEQADSGKIIRELLEVPTTPFMERRLIPPQKFEEFTRWMDEEVEGDGGAQVELLFVRMADLK